jgi:hypothetical protein
MKILPTPELLKSLLQQLQACGFQFYLRLKKGNGLGFFNSQNSGKTGERAVKNQVMRQSGRWICGGKNHRHDGDY